MQGGFFMKKLWKLLMIVSLAALIGFTACDLDIIKGEGDVPAGIPVPGKTLSQKISWLKASGNTKPGNTYLVIVDDDYDLTPQNLSGVGSNVTVILFGGDSEKTLSLTGSVSGSLFTIPSNATLVLDKNITLKGKIDNYYPLVYVSGTLEMRDGSKITGNTNGSTSSYSPFGGGVFVNGTFNMKGGEISNNSASNGGGVYVNAQSATTYGTFRIENGTVYGTDDSTNGNSVTTTGTGAALFVNTSAVAEYGTFAGGWTKAGDIETTDETIEVTNGEYTPDP
jgi:hypothetical protein